MTVKNYLQPEFCSTNYIDANLNPTATIAVTSGTGLGSTTALWDYATDAVYTSSGSADATAFEITIDLGSDQYADTIKLLGINFSSFTIKIKDAASSVYSDLCTESMFEENGYHVNLGGSPQDTFLLSEENAYLLSELGDILIDEYLLIRYIKINCTHTQMTNAEKSIGEIYIGKRVFKPVKNSCQEFNESYPDDLRNIQINSLGKAFLNRGPGCFLANLKFRGLSVTEFRALRDIIKYGGNYTFFPTGGHYGSALSPAFDVKDIYLVTSIEDYNNNPWGSSNSTDTLSISVRETVNVG